MPTVLTQEEKVCSFMEAACCPRDAAERCLERSGGNLHVAVERYFMADEIYERWEPEEEDDGSKKAAAPAVVGEKRGFEEPTTQPVKKAKKPVSTKTPASLGEEQEEPLPWEDAAARHPGAECFNYDAIKSKLVQSNFQGPKDGSTWLWYLVGDMSVYPDDQKGGKTASVHMAGDKFQAGWLRDPKEPAPVDTIKKRQATMLDSVLNDGVNSYGKGRRGCQPGYRHRWTYSDSDFSVVGCEKVPTKTSCTSWDEEKGEDRWTVNIHMQWDSDRPIVEGKYLFVADQRAEKLNKNQYQTSMAGRRWYLGAVDAAPEKLEVVRKSILASLLPKGYKPKKPAVKKLPVEKKVKDL